MATTRERIRRVGKLENAVRFDSWLQFQRLSEGATNEQLEAFAVLGYWPDPPPIAPPKGASRVDSMSQRELLSLFEAYQREEARLASLSQEDTLFFILHDHWSGTACEASDCRKSFSDELQRKYQSSASGEETANVI